MACAGCARRKAKLKALLREGRKGLRLEKQKEVAQGKGK